MLLFSNVCLSTCFIKRRVEPSLQTLIGEAIKTVTQHHQASGGELNMRQKEQEQQERKHT